MAPCLVIAIRELVLLLLVNEVSTLVMLTRPSVSRIRGMIDSCLAGTTTCTIKMSGEISENVKCKVKEFVPDRYKVIVECFIYENNGQSIRIVSKCLWDKDRDIMVQSERVCDDGTTTVVVVVYCIFFE
jgi:hypothetical protein